jgi:hypothetical protein
MGDYFNNINRPNLVDHSLLQKINEIYQMKTQSQPSGPTLVQRAGSAILKLILDNLFMSVIIISLILFLAWCYVEKKRQTAIEEKYFQKLYLKSLKSNDNEYFSKELEPVDLTNLFNEINKDLETPLDIEEKEENNEHKPENKPENKIENNKELAAKKFTNPLPALPPRNDLINGIKGSDSSRYMSVNDFNPSNSYMLL